MAGGLAQSRWKVQGVSGRVPDRVQAPVPEAPGWFGEGRVGGGVDASVEKT